MSSLNDVLRVSTRYFFNIIEILIFIRIIMSWISPGYSRNPLTAFIFNVTEPILAPFRRLLQKSPFGGGMIDFSPIIAILVIRVIIQPIFYTIINLIIGF